MKALSVLLALMVAIILTAGLKADAAKDAKDAKAVTKEGKLVCSKCTLAETDECGNALKVKEGDKTVVYYLKDKGRGEKYHKGVCPANAEKDASVTGVITEDGGKKYITPSEDGVKLK
jgi:hypothetical protein